MARWSALTLGEKSVPTPALSPRVALERSAPPISSVRPAKHCRFPDFGTCAKTIGLATPGLRVFCRSEPVALKRLALRRPDRCSRCSATLDLGTVAWWDSAARTVTCASCHESADPAEASAAPDEAVAAIDRGLPGASLEREHDRRRSNREQAVRDAHPRIGGLLLALTNAPQHEAAFLRGLKGERAVAESLEKRTSGTPVITLHNRRMPQGRGDIDHLAVAPAGVFVIDAKAIRGAVRVDQPWFGQPKLLVNGRDKTKLIDGLDRQVNAVRAALDAAGCSELPVHGVMCFTEADLPLIGTQRIRGHLLIYRKALAKRLNAPGPLVAETIEPTARVLAKALPAA